MKKGEMYSDIKGQPKVLLDLGTHCRELELHCELIEIEDLFKLRDALTIIKSINANDETIQDYLEIVNVEIESR